MTWLYYILFMTNLCWWVWWDSMQRNAVTMTHICLYYIWRVDLKKTETIEMVITDLHILQLLFFIICCLSALSNFLWDIKLTEGKEVDERLIELALPELGTMCLQALESFQCLPCFRSPVTGEWKTLSVRVWSGMMKHTKSYTTHTHCISHTCSYCTCLSSFSFSLTLFSQSQLFWPCSR